MHASKVRNTYETIPEILTMISLRKHYVLNTISRGGGKGVDNCVENRIDVDIL